MNRRSFLRNGIWVLATPSLILPRKSLAQVRLTGAKRGGFSDGATPAVAANIVVVSVAKGHGSTGSVNASISPTAGNTLIAVAACSGGSVQTLSDNIGSTTGWTTVGNQNQGGSSRIRLWYKANIPAGITTVTFADSTGTFNTLIVHQVSGLSSSPFTGGEVANLTSSGATLNPQIGPVTNATANSIYFACVTTADQASDPAQMNINGTGTVGTWNLFNSTNSQELDQNNFTVMSVPNIIVASSAARTHGWAFATAVDSGGLIAAFHV